MPKPLGELVITKSQHRAGAWGPPGTGHDIESNDSSHWFPLWVPDDGSPATVCADENLTSAQLRQLADFVDSVAPGVGP